MCSDLLSRTSGLFRVQKRDSQVLDCLGMVIAACVVCSKDGQACSLSNVMCGESDNKVNGSEKYLFYFSLHPPGIYSEVMYDLAKFS